MFFSVTSANRSFITRIKDLFALDTFCEKKISIGRWILEKITILSAILTKILAMKYILRYRLIEEDVYKVQTLDPSAPVTPAF